MSDQQPHHGRMQPPPLPDHWSRENALQYVTQVRDPARSCVYCQHVDVRVLIPPVRGYTRSLGCLHPKALYGQAGEGKNCCSFMREPGADDELVEGPVNLERG